MKATKKKPEVRTRTLLEEIAALKRSLADSRRSKRQRALILSELRWLVRKYVRARMRADR